MDFVHSVEIAATPDVVWRVLVDVERWPEWTDSMTKVERLDRGTFRRGSAARIKQPRFGPMTWQVTEFEPGKSFTWVARNVGVATVAVHRLAPAASGGVTVTLEIHQFGPLSGLLGLFARRITRRYVRMEAAGLKEHCES